MNNPNFMIIGAMKSGTTALYYFLKQHPQVFMSAVKEPNFFALLDKKNPQPIEGAKISILDIESYLALFDETKDEIAIGEASHSYMYYQSALNQIKRLFPQTALICILRNPIERAYSHYLFHRRDDREPINNFNQAILAEEKRIREGIHFGHYIRRGMYYNQVKRLYETFLKEQVYVCLFDELEFDPVSLSQNIYHFLNVDPGFIPDVFTRRNPSGIPKNKTLHTFLVKPNQLKSFIQPILPSTVYHFITKLRDRNLSKPQLDQEHRNSLIELYREDILKLQKLINRDLSNWLS